MVCGGNEKACDVEWPGREGKRARTLSRLQCGHLAVAGLKNISLIFSKFESASSNSRRLLGSKVDGRSTPYS